MIDDPSAASEQEVVSATAESSAASIRRENLKHEASVKAIGILYCLGAVLLIVAGIVALVSEEDESLVVRLLVGSLFLVLKPA
jgi:hypothetical protein